MVLLTTEEIAAEFIKDEYVDAYLSSKVLSPLLKAVALAQARRDYKWGIESCYTHGHLGYINRKQNCPECQRSFREELGL